MPVQSKLDEQNTHKTWDELKQLSDAFRGTSTAPSTKQQYNNLTNEFKQFLAKFNISEDTILPLKTEHIESWFSSLLASRPMRWESFCKRVAALRSFSRNSGFFELEHLNYNTQNSKFSFCSFMNGLKRKLDKVPRKKAQALTAELLTYVLDDILRNDPNKYLALRDVIILSLGFLLGLRAFDIAVINTKHITLKPDSFNPQANSFDVIVDGGK